MGCMGVTTIAPMRGDRRRPARGRPSRLLSLTLAGLLLELVLLLGFLRPLSIRRHPDPVSTEQSLATALGTDFAGALRFVVPVLCAFAAFGLALWLAQTMAGRAAAFGVVLAGTVIFSFTLLPTNPLAARDVYHNVADARTLWLYGDNPTVLPPITHADDPLYEHVSVWQEYPSVYGPVWYLLAGAPLPFAGDRLWPNVLGQKALTALFLLGTTVLAMLAAERIRPGTAVAAGVLVGWNPLLQFETAGNAHNDVVMVYFALAALYAVTRGWWVAVFPLLALSVASKYVLVLLGPLLLVWLLRRRDVPRRQVSLSLALGALVGAAVYVPFFAGMDTLAGLRRQSGFNTSSPSALLYALLWNGLQPDPVQSSRTMKLIVVPLFLLAYAVLLWRIPRHVDVAALVRAGFWAVFLLLTIATWWFWPWYLLWLVPLGALVPAGWDRPALIAAVFSATAMLLYVPFYWLMHGDVWLSPREAVALQAATAGTGFLLPVVLALAPIPFRRAGRLSRPMDTD